MYSVDQLKKFSVEQSTYNNYGFMLYSTELILAFLIICNL